MLERYPKATDELDIAEPVVDFAAPGDGSGWKLSSFQSSLKRSVAAEHNLLCSLSVYQDLALMHNSSHSFDSVLGWDC